MNSKPVVKESKCCFEHIKIFFTSYLLLFLCHNKIFDKRETNDKHIISFSVQAKTSTIIIEVNVNYNMLNI